MAIHTASLNLLAFPQRWNPVAGEIVVRGLCLPPGDPRAVIAPATVAFAAADIRYEAFLVANLDHVPRAADAASSGPLASLHPPLQKTSLFDELAVHFDIDPTRQRRSVRR